MCTTQIHTGYTRTYVSAGELATPTMPTDNIGILISVTNPVIEPPPQDREMLTSCLEADVLPLGYRTRFYDIT